MLFGWFSHSAKVFKDNQERKSQCAEHTMVKLVILFMYGKNTFACTCTQLWSFIAGTDGNPEAKILHDHWQGHLGWWRIDRSMEVSTLWGDFKMYFHIGSIYWKGGLDNQVDRMVELADVSQLLSLAIRRLTTQWTRGLGSFEIPGEGSGACAPTHQNCVALGAGSPSEKMTTTASPWRPVAWGQVDNSTLLPSWNR